MNFEIQLDTLFGLLRVLSIKRLGAPQRIDFTEADGRITKRWLRPVLDENDAWLYWIPA